MIPKNLNNSLNSLFKDKYDYFLINTPPHIDERINKAFIISDSVLLITDISQVSLNGLLKIISKYKSYCADQKLVNNIEGILINQCKNDRATKEFTKHLERTKEIANLPVKPYISNWTWLKRNDGVIPNQKMHPITYQLKSISKSNNKL